MLSILSTLSISRLHALNCNQLNACNADTVHASNSVIKFDAYNVLIMKLARFFERLYDSDQPHQNPVRKVSQSVLTITHTVVAHRDASGAPDIGAGRVKVL